MRIINNIGNLLQKRFLSGKMIARNVHLVILFTQEPDVENSLNMKEEKRFEKVKLFSNSISLSEHTASEMGRVMKVEGHFGIQKKRGLFSKDFEKYMIHTLWSKILTIHSSGNFHV